MRCFVAVWPTPDVVDALEALPRPALDGLRWSARQQWHVTLRFFGDLGTQEVTEASAAVARAAADAREPPLAQGGPGTRFLGPGLLVWPVEGLGQVASALDGLTAAIGTPPPSRSFYGHITLARGRRGLGPSPRDRVVEPPGVVMDRHIVEPCRERASPRRGPLPAAGGVPLPRRATARPFVRATTGLGESGTEIAVGPLFGQLPRATEDDWPCAPSGRLP
jgi:2'-5' RNA ligase